MRFSEAGRNTWTLLAAWATPSPPFVSAPSLAGSLPTHLAMGARTNQLPVLERFEFKTPGANVHRRALVGGTNSSSSAR
jgi:hypothetical protein